MFVRTSLSIAAVALIVTAGSAFAQTQPAPPAPPAAAGVPARHHGGMKRLFSTLNLSADQQSKIDAIFAKYRQQNQNVTDPAQRHANRTAMLDEINAVLTPDQQAKFKAAVGAMRKRREAERREGAVPLGAPLPAATPIR